MAPALKNLAKSVNICYTNTVADNTEERFHKRRIFIMKDSKWSYVSGLIDGEGSIQINKTKAGSYEIKVKLGNTDLRLMKWLISNFGGVYYTEASVRSSSHKVLYQWFVKGAKNKELFLLGVIPYLVLKREQAVIALEYVRLNKSKFNQPEREEMFQKLKVLNKRGISATTNTQETSKCCGAEIFLHPESSHLDVDVMPNQKYCRQCGRPCEVKIESDLTGDCESAPDVNQGLDIDHCPRCKEYLHDEMGHMCPV
jgi:hypothetical protein